MASRESARDPGSARDLPRPRVVLSRCLEVEACRYNGRMIRSVVVRGLEPWVDFVPVCPEVEVGLGTPRDPIRLVRIEERTRLVQPSTGRDLTGAMEAFREGFLDGVGDVDGFVLKSRSPSCGIDGISVYAGAESDDPVGSEPGMFASAVLRRFPHTPVEHEGRLADPGLRDAWLTRIFALADLRRVSGTGRMVALVEFQAHQKLTLMARSPSLQRELGRIVANPERRPFAEVIADYRAVFRRALASEPGPGAHQNVIQHAQGYFREHLSPEEKERFGSLLRGYRQGRVGRGVLLELIRGWIRRFGEDYVARQSYLDPYPRELLDLSPSDEADRGVTRTPGRGDP